MRRGRSNLFLLLLLVILAVGGLLYFRMKQPGRVVTEHPMPTAMPMVTVVVTAQSIAQGAQITEEMLTTVEIPQTMWLAAYFTDTMAVVGQYAKYPLDAGIVLTTAMVAPTAGETTITGSRWATLIPPGWTAISIPITRLSAAAYGIRDGDRVDVIATMLMVEVDQKYQSILPNSSAAILSAKGRGVLLGGGTVEEPSPTLASSDKIQILTNQVVSGLSISPMGRVEQDPNLNVPLYAVPSERQRPRLVSQMVIKNVQVLRVGTFPLVEEQETGQVGPVAEATPGATPMPTPVPAQTVTERPDIITLIVSPQDAVALTYFLYGGAQLTLTLRNPTDTNVYDTEAATLSYILAQYNIPVPLGLPFALEPRLDQLEQPVLPNDVIVVAP